MKIFGDYLPSDEAVFTNREMFSHTMSSHVRSHIRSMHHFNKVVVGAGPSGLALASRTTDALVLEAGKPLFLRDRENPISSLRGQGGAGAYGDGKWSSFPSGTAVWDIDHSSHALNCLNEDISTTGSKVVVSGPASPVVPFKAGSEWGLKEYPSEYLTIEERYSLIEGLAQKAIDRGNLISYGTSLVSEEKCDGKHILSITDCHGTSQISCDVLVYAGGRRFGGVHGPKKFRRVEVGMRMQFPKEYEIKEFGHLTDPKSMIRIGKGKESGEFRTFCNCRGGEVVMTDHNGVRTFSGRADCPPTGFTNHGFNLRFHDESYVDDLILIYEQEPFVIPMTLAINSNVLLELYGERIGRLYRIGLKSYITRYNFDPSVATLHGPTVEGVGYYSDIGEKTLRVNGEDLDTYVIGDSSGIFRGNTAAMISGYALARTLE